MKTYTFGMIKSKAIERGHALDMLVKIAKSGFVIEHLNRIYLRVDQIDALYHEHMYKPYYPNLYNSVNYGVVAFVLSTHKSDNPVVKALPSGTPIDLDYAVNKFRKLIGSTNASTAEEGTLRNLYGGYRYSEDAPLADNAAHGSDNLTSVIREIDIILPDARIEFDHSKDHDLPNASSNIHY